MRPSFPSRAPPLARTLTLALETAVHLNFCPVPPPFPLNQFNPRVLLDWMPRFVLPDAQRAKIERGVAYLEKGSVRSPALSPSLSLERASLTLFTFAVRPTMPCSSSRCVRGASSTSERRRR